MSRARRIGFATLIAALLTFITASATAHPLRTTAVTFDIGERAVAAELQLPIDQLELALQRPIAARTSTLVAEEGAALAAYVKDHMRAKARDGRPFALDIGTMNIATIDGASTLVVEVAMQPPSGAPASAFDLHYDVILHRVVPHKIFVSIRRDFANAIFSDQPKLVDMLGFQHADLTIDQSSGSSWVGMRSVFVLGMRHIAEGTDHLLFLIVLLLPAALIARRGRWGETSKVSRSAKDVARIVTAFTVGHSVTLVVAALGLLRVPSRPVEVLIAISILVSAVHAVRPLFAGREPLVAAGFGLVHGLAFATVLTDLGFEQKALWLGVVGFNLGIEAMQLLVIVLVMPSLLLLSQSPSYARMRVWSATGAGLLAAGWVAERAFGLANPFAGLVDVATKNGLVVVGALAVAAVVVRVRENRSATVIALGPSGPLGERASENAGR